MNIQQKVQTFYSDVKDVGVGRLFTNDELESITSLPLEYTRPIIYRTNKLLLTEHNKMLINVRKVGYKMGLPEEQSKQGMFRKIRAKRQLDKGVLELTYLDTSNMSYDEKQRHMQMLCRYQSSLKLIRKRNIEALDATKKSVDTLEKAVEIQEKGLVTLDDIMARITEIEKKLK